MAGVKLLSESVVLQQMIETMKADIIANSGQNVETYIKNLPNEAKGDPRPNSGLYLSGDGVVKIA